VKAKKLQNQESQEMKVKGINKTGGGGGDA